MKREDTWPVVESLLDLGFTPRVRRYKKFTDPKEMKGGVALALYVPFRDGEERKEILARVCEKHGVKVTYEDTRFVTGNEMATIR